LRWPAVLVGPSSISQVKESKRLTNLATQGLDYILDHTQPTQDQLSHIIQSLIISPGPSQLAAHNSYCCVSVCSALINILSQEDARIALLRLDALLSFARLPYRYGESKQRDEVEDDDAMRDLQQCRKTYLKLVYELTAMTEFQERYTLESQQIQEAIMDLQELKPISIYLCVILANLTTSIHTAEDLVAKYKIHKPVLLLLQNNDAEVHPAIGLLVKLALPDANKSILAQFGAFDSLLYLLKTQTSNDIKREAVVATRLLIKGHRDNLILLTNKTPKNNIVKDQDHLLPVILGVFAQTGDDSIKLEIGRLVIEICRTIFKDGNAEGQLDRSFDGNPLAAKAMAFVARFGQGGAQSEGWFGLAMMSVLPKGQSMVISALDDGDLLKEMRKVAALKEGPSFENLGLMLTKLQPLQVCSNNVAHETAVLTRSRRTKCQKR